MIFLRLDHLFLCGKLFSFRTFFQSLSRAQGIYQPCVIVQIPFQLYFKTCFIISSFLLRTIVVVLIYLSRTNIEAKKDYIVVNLLGFFVS